VFVDTDPETLSVRVEDIESAITEDTAGFIVVHIGGTITGQIDKLRALAERRNIWMVEDAAHAHGSRFNGAHSGTFGIAGAFSFYPTKVMTSGEGGMIITNDDRIAEEARIYRDQGKASFLINAHVRLGSNWRMSEPHAIIGLRHLSRLDDMVRDRRRIARIYDRELQSSTKLRSLKPADGSESNYYKYIAILNEELDRAELRKLLREQFNVSLSGEVYETPLHKQPVFESLATRSLPVSEDLCARHICLPIYSGMTEESAMQVVNAVEATL
jgi:Predicted pyridoxal phosphate-dependent enzyme apparently involved in regulation of cell wall biogenesis